MTLSEALTAEATRQGLSYSELARRAEMSVGRVHTILTGGTPNPGLLTVRAILAALGKPFAWLDKQLS